MSLMGIFGNGLSGLQAAQQGLRVVSQNVANVNTPGYARRDVEFMDQLADALDASGGSRRARVEEMLDTTAREVVEDKLFFRVDKGGVDIDREMAEMAKNSLYGAAMSSFMSSKVRMYKQVIRGGRF